MSSSLSCQSTSVMKDRCRSLQTSAHRRRRERAHGGFDLGVPVAPLPRRVGDRLEHTLNEGRRSRGRCARGAHVKTTLADAGSSNRPAGEFKVLPPSWGHRLASLTAGSHRLGPSVKLRRTSSVVGRVTIGPKWVASRAAQHDKEPADRTENRPAGPVPRWAT
jgi:hypothetical protein